MSEETTTIEVKARGQAEDVGAAFDEFMHAFEEFRRPTTSGSGSSRRGFPQTW